MVAETEFVHKIIVLFQLITSKYICYLSDGLHTYSSPNAEGGEYFFQLSPLLRSFPKIRGAKDDAKDDAMQNTSMSLQLYIC